MTALDISSNALKVAKKNAEINNVDINFINEDIEQAIFTNKFDVLVSNPPYVAFDVETDEKIKYEPQNAIFAKDNGLYFYKVILDKSINFLNKKNIIAFEIGHNQAETIIKMVNEYYPQAKVVAKNDLNGYNRYIYIFND